MFPWLCCVGSGLAAWDRVAVRVALDDSSEFGDRGRDAAMG
jgi:hypothetical protein